MRPNKRWGSVSEVRMKSGGEGHAAAFRLSQGHGIVVFTQGCYPVLRLRRRTHPPHNASCASGGGEGESAAPCWPQRLMNNKIIIPIHGVIKWDWLYLPVCSHWAQSSIIIRSGGVCDCSAGLCVLLGEVCVCVSLCEEPQWGL